MSSTPKVMIVEDEAIIALDIQSHLTRVGFEVTGVARSAAEAFQLIEQKQPDIVLMDIRIEGDLDGVQAAGIIRSRYGLPVIYLTAHADEATLERAEATEPFGYIVKPLQHFKVKAVIAMALRRHRTERELQESRNLLSATLHQLEVAKQAAEAANSAKSDFLARMSHEIRTPMNLIMGMNALLLESPLNEKQKQHVEISHRNVRRLLRLINGILDLSKVEAGELSFEAVPFDLNEVLKECAATISAAIERKGLELEIFVDLSAGRYWLGDAERLQQVLLNLIGNSIKFTAEGRIEVRVRSESGAGEEKGLRFEVADSGCGIPQDKAAMIFEAFQQVDGSINRPFEGTGLGLAIAKTLVERMSGAIWVDQSYKPGAKFVFTVFLPAAEESALRKKISGSASAQVTGGVEAGTRILLVEDNPENVILLRAYLENLSLSIDLASNGVEAVTRRQQGEYDLVLMDVQMPVMDGYTATREIRSWEAVTGARRVPIVALTAHALSGAAGESAEAGCDAHLTKPLERTDLIEAIAKFAVRPVMRAESISDLIQSRRPAFLANRWLDLEKMRSGLAAQDFAAIQKIAHNCKGIGKGYGFPQIGEIGASIEKAAKALDPSQILQCIGQFERCLHNAAREAA
jgi:signal transduction histidine kinase/HPt (histidine-containing phosphotransfer) domain-containing protein